VRPKALTSVDEGFCLSANGHKKYRRCEDNTVGVEHFRGDELIVIFDDTGACFVAGIALDAGGDFEIRQPDVFGLSAGGFCAGQSLAEKDVAITIKPGACRDSDYFQGHIGSKLTVFVVKSNRGERILIQAIDKRDFCRYK
jgi:hypothetical protein